ncbi:gliding motility protein GldM [Flammeovirga sp. MY04]|uniref:type IX secretion system motor protein PorM/GldM n=1 Tax=Flammeovirga sp. MY04 TaxID=1191459 RepID=UPI0008060FD7|nr:gliding motility protein GldM [Flammeovirga sp. MY04]ANQ50637.1 gliding motility protein GldM [Flammeovirga sp. MY04]
MAGGKETPRQRMIGLMYLVLMAMLALNVSNTVLDKFMFIERALNEANEIKIQENDRQLHAIEAAVKKKNNAITQEVLKEATALRTETVKVTDLIEELKQEIIKKSGDYDESTGELKGKSDTQIPAEIMIGVEGAKKKGKAYDLEKKLNELAKHYDAVAMKFDTTKTWRKIGKLAKSAKEMEQYKNDKDNKNKDYAQIQFEDTPVAAALAVLTEVSSEVLQAETKVLQVLNDRVGGRVVFDKVVAVVKPTSKFVAAGLDYEATMFIAASSSAAKPRMKQNGADIKVEAGVGTIKFPAKAAKYDKNGRSTQTWKGEITYTTPFGDTTLLVEEEYVVVRPTISVNSATVNALYRNVANKLVVDVPALGESYSPRFSATNASVKGSGKTATIIPTQKAKSVVLTVNSGGNRIGTKTFKTRGVPKPTIKFPGVDMKKGISRKTSKLRVVPEPDAEFKAALPDEANYRVVDWEVTVAFGTKPIGKPMRVTGGNQSMDIGRLLRNAPKTEGVRIVVDVKKVVRKNSLGKTETVPGVGGITTIAVN